MQGQQLGDVNKNPSSGISPFGTGGNRRRNGNNFFCRQVQTQFCGSIEAHRINLFRASSKKDWASAIRECDLILQISPRDSKILCARGYANYMLKNFVQARKDYLEAYSVEPHDTYPLKMIVEIYLDLGRFKDAIIICERMISIDPHSIFGYWTTGKAFLKMKQAKKAQGMLEKSLKLTTTIRDGRIRKMYSSRILSDLGKSYSMQGKYKQSIKFLQDALDLDQKNNGVFKRLAMAHYMLGMELRVTENPHRRGKEMRMAFEIARDLFLEYEQKDVEYEQRIFSRCRRAECCMQLGRYAEAKEIIEDALKSSPKNKELKEAMRKYNAMLKLESHATA